MLNNRFFLLVVFLFAFCIALVGCGDNDSSDSESTTGPNENDDDDIADDDDNTPDVDDDSDDDDDDDDDNDDEPLPFPELDPAACTLEDPADLLGFDTDYALLQSGNWVWDKNYYLLTLFSMAQEAVSTIENDAGLVAISAERDNWFRQGITDCNQDIACWEDFLTWSELEAEAAALALSSAFGYSRSYDPSGEDLLPSGEFIFHAELNDDELLEAAWLDTIEGLHQAFSSYVESLPPAQLDTIAAAIDTANPDAMLFFEPLLYVVLSAMEYHGRDEAGRYEPMAVGENMAAVQRIPSIDWDDYRFSVIFVPGRGPDTDIPLHPTGKIRCDMAAKRYEAGLAPFIVVSGGHVHPDGTQYCEAIEMKSYLMNNHGILEEAILVDPHARHTTTNLRNVTRLVFRYGIPHEKPVLVNTDFFQNFYIDFILRPRCLDELGYVPWRKLARLGVSDTCLLVNPVSLYVDSTDPLDP